MNPGPGRRVVTEQIVTIKEWEDAQQPKSTDISSEKYTFPTVECQPAIILADSMGGCFLQTDQYFRPVVKPAYGYEWMAKDIVEEVVNIQRYKNIVFWAGAHAIHQIELDQVEADLRGLINVVVPRNRKALIYVSTLIPKPRENHLTAPRFRRYNDAIQKVVLDFQKIGQEVFCLNSDRIFLDHNNDIVRPIIDNFHDGFHLNYKGAQKLRDFWVQTLQKI